MSFLSQGGSAPVHADEEVVIRPPARWSALDLREIWRYRELSYFLTRRDVLIRYKQSLIGLGWAVLQPLALMFLFSIFFGRLANLPSDGVPYPVFSLAALVPWTFASQGVAQAANSLVGDSNLLTKVYFPRLVLPIGRLFSVAVDLAIAFVMLLIFMACYGLFPSASILVVCPLVALAATTALGAGALLAAINVRYRDVTMLVPLAIQLWLFATPVVYPGSLITGGWAYVYALNPMVTVISGFRWALLGTPGPSAASAVISVTAAATLLLGALVYFRRVERHFADII